MLAIDQLVNERQEQPTVPKAVTLEVAPEQAQKILLASSIGKLSLILRQPGDGKTDGDKRVTERDLGRNQPRPRIIPTPPPPPPPGILEWVPAERVLLRTFGPAIDFFNQNLSFTAGPHKFDRAVMI